MVEHHLVFFAIFVDKLRGKMEDGKSNTDLSQMAKDAFNTTEMVMGVSVPIYTIPSAYSSKAANVILEFIKRVSGVMGTIEQQTDIIAAKLEASGMTTASSSSSISLDEIHISLHQ